MSNSLATPWDKFKGFLFRLFPHHLVSRATYWVTRQRGFFVKYAITTFIKHFKVDMSDAQFEDIHHYQTFNEFFTRKLKDSARPIEQNPQNIICPCDGAISMHGRIKKDTLIQAKNKFFSVTDFLTPASNYIEHFTDGYFFTIYLSPRDYHRVHIPCDARLEEMIYVPGRLFSVAPYAPKTIDKLFARNERVIPIFSIQGGHMAAAMVGAVNVAAIEMSWAGLITPPHRSAVKRYEYGDQTPVKLQKSDHMGTFNMGSTVVLLFSKGCINPIKGLENNQKVKFGQSLGQFN